MQMMLIKWWLFFLMLGSIKASKLWKLNDLSASERTMKTILDSCYEDETPFNPIVTINFDVFSDGSSFIRLDADYDIDEEKQNFPKSKFKAGKMILRAHPQIKLRANLRFLRNTRWWNHMASFFIVEKLKKTCSNVATVLMTAWKMNILNSIYICNESTNTTALYTLNPIANYAPSPWERIDEFTDINVFRQIFDPNTSCENLHYDKTSFLNGYEIKLGEWTGSFEPVHYESGKNYFETALEHASAMDYRVLYSVIRTLNGTGNFKLVEDADEFKKWIVDEVKDMEATTAFGGKFNKLIWCPIEKQWIVLLKLSPEISTLTKMVQLCSAGVLIATGVVVVITVIILIILTRDFSIAMLEITRLLTSTSILSNNRSHTFRLYLTAVLFFVIIIYGTLQGNIPTYLMKGERHNHVHTIHELEKLGYEFYVDKSRNRGFTKNCPKCTFIEVERSDCIKYAQTQPLHACIIREDLYEPLYYLHPLERIKQPVTTLFTYYNTRPDWPLRDRVSGMVMRVFESGVIDFWKKVKSNWARDKHRAMEAEWSSPQYRPVTLYQLRLAFVGLALGLLTATIVFFLELSPTMWRLMKRRLAECRMTGCRFPKCRLAKCNFRECKLGKRLLAKCGSYVLELLAIFLMCLRSLRRLREHVIQNRAK